MFARLRGEVMLYTWKPQELPELITGDPIKRLGELFSYF